ncbi:MAG: peptidylprolyl isomerase [candidate division Zixibacteria bacterium]|jgi:cyclophilin family peptidyl-prolyl cis-trans isomerase|nr:peptidylprolyl isomerase [candidate division Zixibacteria bacterium]
MKKLLLTLTLGAAMMAHSGCGPETETPIRNKENHFVTLETSMGNLTLELYRDVAPAHADSFLARTNEGFYDGTVFHRIIKGFMIQGGDPTGTGAGDAGYRLNAEFSDLKHERGILSMARGPHPNSASCQFFICFANAPHLDGQYTVFGRVVNGSEALNKLEQTPVGPSRGGENSAPVEEVTLIKAYESTADGKAL